MSGEVFRFWFLKLQRWMFVVLFFFSLEKKEPKNPRQKNSFTQGRHPHPHFVFQPLFDSSNQATQERNSPRFSQNISH